MDTDILILQLRQSGLTVPSDVGQVAFITADSLYALLRQAAPLCGLATEAEVKKQFPAKLPTTSPSARYYVLNTFDALLKKKSSNNDGNNNASNDNNNNNKNRKAAGAPSSSNDNDNENDEAVAACPSTTEGLMYPSEPTTRAVLSWVVSAIAAYQQQQQQQKRKASSVNGKKGGGGADDDDEDDPNALNNSVAPSISRVLSGSLALLRSAVVDNSAVTNPKPTTTKTSSSVSAAVLFATPTYRKFRTYTATSGSSSGNAIATAADSSAMMVPVAPPPSGPATATAADAAAHGLNQLRSICKQSAALGPLAPKLCPARGKIFTLSQSLTALLPSPSLGGSKKGEGSNNNNKGGMADTFVLDEDAVYGASSGAARSRRLQAMAAAHASSAMGTLFFNTDASGLSGAFANNNNNNGNNNGSPLKNNKTKAEKEEETIAEAARQMEEVEDKAKSAAQRVEEREAELARVHEALSAAKKDNKALRQQLAVAEEEFAAYAATIAEESVAVAAKEASLSARRSLLERLQSQLKWMEDYEGTVATFEAEVAEAKALQRQVQEDLAQKLSKMEGKKEELVGQVAAAGSGRQEEILALRNKVKKIKREIRLKTREIADLHAEYDRVPKDIDRSLFLRFIFDLTNNIQRQQAEVDKVKADLHKEATTITEKTARLQELFSAVEQEVYKKIGVAAATTAVSASSPTFGTTTTSSSSSSTSNSNSTATTSSAFSKPSKTSSNTNNANANTNNSPDDEFSREAFKRIVAIREAYANLRSAIQSRGAVRHEVHILEEKSSKAARLAATQDVKKVATDLEAVEVENEELSAKLEKYLESRGSANGNGNVDEDDDDEDENDDDKDDGKDEKENEKENEGVTEGEKGEAACDAPAAATEEE